MDSAYFELEPVSSNPGEVDYETLIEEMSQRPELNRD
jgi:hypothetical protein